VLVDRLDQLVEPIAPHSNRFHDRRSPVSGRAALAEPDHVLDLTHRGVGPVAVGLVDREDVADLEDAGLGRLDAVSHPGRQQHHGAVGQTGDLDLGLADADRLDQHDLAARRVEHPQRLRGRAGQAAEVAAGRHRPDVDPRVERHVLHAHPVTEQRASGERRARVDRQHPDPQPSSTVRRDKGRCRGGLAHPR
jgi:hypothetical protein